MSNPLDEPSIPTPESSSRTTPAPETAGAGAAAGSEGTPSQQQRLAIEGPRPGQSTAAEAEEVTTLDVGGGNVVRLDKLGPMIINSDGTLSRIQNWQDLHPIEQERTVRLLVKKRNLVRLKKLDDENRSAEGGAQSGENDGEESLTALKA